MKPLESAYWKKGRVGMAIAAVMMVTLAGCLGDGTGAEEPAAPDEDSLPPTDAGLGVGTVEGVVLDEEALPVAAADVIVDGHGISTKTDDAGAFRFEEVPAGEQDVRVLKEGYEPVRLPVDVPAGGTVGVEVRLVILPVYAAHNQTRIFEGHYDCAHEVPIWTGDCMILYESIMNESDPYTSETMRFLFEVEPRWETFVMELVWEGSANNQLEGMRFYLEHVTDMATDHSVKVGRADGAENPLRFTVQRDEPHPRADIDEETGEPATFPLNGSTAQVRVFPHGRLYDESCMVGQIVFNACTLGVGVGVDMKFTVYATVFYNEPAPDGFTAVPGA